MKSIPVFYTPKMVANYRCPSPSASKPTKVVESWQRQFSIDVTDFEPASIDDLIKAHDEDFVREILACKRDNGFGDRSPEAASSLPYTSGAMAAAAKYAYVHKTVAVAPCSGFHHAGWMSAEGFCTFNGLMVTALMLKEMGANRIGILDLDMHYGNGTDDIIRKLNAHDWIKHFTGGVRYTEPSQVDEFFQVLPTVLEYMSDCDVILYQAGADPHVNDPYGGWLTTDELRRRDAIIFDRLSLKGIPVAWNLAGGYQTERDGSIPKVLEIHDNTMRECVRVYVEKA